MSTQYLKSCSWEKHCCKKTPFVDHSHPQRVVFFDMSPKGFNRSIGDNDYNRTAKIPEYQNEKPTCSERKDLYQNCINARKNFWALYLKLKSSPTLEEEEEEEDNRILLEKMQNIIDTNNPIRSIRIQLSNLGFSGKK